VFAGLGYPRIPQAAQLDQVLGDIASSQFVQQLACAITSIRSGFMSGDDNAIWQQVTASSLAHMYSEANTVTADRIIERLEVRSASPENQHARRILERFLRLHAQDIALLRSFLRYATGSGRITGTTLRIEVSESEQCISFQTCLGIISMPNIVADPIVEEVILLHLEAELRNQNWIFNDV
jgi:hypothetical protein